MGRSGQLQVKPGFYLYVGSAFGPGGLAARIRHHFCGCRKPHWHLDYVKSCLKREEVYFCAGEKMEHQWAGRLCLVKGVRIPRPGFGSSDCTCVSHLFFAPSRKSLCRILKEFQKLAGLVAARVTADNYNGQPEQVQAAEPVPVTALVRERKLT
ncbi:MAG TPA: DUF123 domain-containing protein [bacterium]|nr:DUF123 domain-containing protein [bacterium]